MKVDKTIINEFNRQNVLNTIRNNNPISRSEISTITNLSVPTVMKIAENFINMGLLREVGKGESSGGKPPVLLEFVPDSYYCVGIDIGNNKILGVMTNCSSHILYRYSVCNSSRDPDDVFLKKIAGVIQNVIENSGVPQNKILGIGIGISGLIRDSDHKVIFSPILLRKDLDLYSYIAGQFDFPIILDNISRVMVIGEKYYGVCKESENFIVINLGYGIGAGIYANGRIYNGNSGFSGEMGHIIVNPLGPKCMCGNRGCLETIASAIAITTEAKNRINAHESTKILDIIGGNVNNLDAVHVFQAAKAGDKVAMDIVMNAIDYLGMGVACMTNILDPEYVVFGGGISLAGDFLLKPLTAAWEKYRMSYSGRNTKLVISEFGPDASAIGAAALVFDLLMKKGYKPQKLLHFKR